MKPITLDLSEALGAKATAEIKLAQAELKIEQAAEAEREACLGIIERFIRMETEWSWDDVIAEIRQRGETK